MHKKILPIGILTITLAGCSSLHPTAEKQSITTQDLNEQQVQAIAWMNSAAEYKALCYQAFNVAKTQVKQALASVHKKPLAVVVDVDETVLNNLPYQAWLVQTNQTYSSRTWMQWVKTKQATAIPGAVEFLSFANENGIEVFYITNRKASGDPATLTNLKALGFPDADHQHLLSKTTTSDKSERRQYVREHYHVAVYMGDNLGDFSHKFDHQSSQNRAQLAQQYRSQWGKKYIVLPNPTYGTWDGAVIHYQWGASPEEKDRLRKAALPHWQGAPKK